MSAGAVGDDDVMSATLVVDPSVDVIEVTDAC